MADDPAAEILRVKNRLSPRYDSAQSAGYRDVAVNLRIRTDETRWLGVAGHVCEVQLLLQPFADLKVALLVGHIVVLCCDIKHTRLYGASIKVIPAGLRRARSDPLAHTHPITP